MPEPLPLTLCPPARIDFGDKGAPEAPEFGDIYFSTDGGLTEAQAVFLAACGLPDRWHGTDYFAIGELGFGTGLNFLAAWQMWDRSKSTGSRLHFISIEKFPLDHKQLRQALSHWPELDQYADQLVKKWPGRVKGFHSLEFGDVTLTLIHEGCAEALPQISGQIDAWFLDGFSPSKNPDMWSPDVMEELARLSSPGCQIGTFTVARAVREALTEAGFEVAKKEGFGRKRDRLEAIYPGQTAIRRNTKIKPVIIGGGIAGACLAYSFAKRGIQPTIIDANDGTAASGNAAALVKPRLDLQDRPESRFFLSSYLFALQRYHALGGIFSESIKHICPTAKEQTRFEKLSRQKPLPKSHFNLLPNNDFEFPQSMVITPKEIVENSCANSKMIAGSGHHVKDGRILDAQGGAISEGSHFFWSCGFGIRDLQQFSGLKLRYSRGQLSYARTETDQAVTYGGYAIPLKNATLLGATHKRLDGQSPFEARIDDDRKNFEKFLANNGGPLEPASRPSRSSVRVTTPSTLPLIFGGDQEWGLTGLGSRGFVFAPLLAEAIVAKICGEVLPISDKAWTRFRARENVPT
ncbi:MAG: tRNA (5-methylaminomethyl-2-thiouridine)(34)-methyltransferase MnmD [Hellea sp.]|nr:tRNA (5-methylaminomethyl-2-thiouridine)(34)-methyltransferase MnmD [Hellea sp.]